MRIINSVTASAAALLLASGTAHAVPTNIPAMQSTITYSKTSAGPSYFSNYAWATSTVVYDPATQTYTIRDTGSLTTKSSFGPANISSSNSKFVTYNKGTNESFRLLNKNPSNPLIALTYVDYGQWRRTSTAGGTTNVNDTYLVFGTKAPSTAVTSGTGSYSTIVDGSFVNKTGAYTVSGAGTFTANFSGGTIAYSTTASATPETTGSAFAFGTMGGTGSIAVRGASFAGHGTTNSSGYAMDVNGNFYGPAAQEIGGLFHIRGNGGNGTGAIVGH